MIDGRRLAAVVRSIKVEEERRISDVIGRIEFGNRLDMAACVTCGARLQDGRCPWARLMALPSIDGRTYCDWPKSHRPTAASATFQRRK